MSLVGKVILTENHILKVSQVTENNIFGFNIITEECVSISIHEKYIENPKSILPLIQKEKARFNYVNVVFPNESIENKSLIIGISERTFYRITDGIETNKQYRFNYKK